MGDNFIPCLKWIKRGVAKSNPEFVKLSKEELKELLQKAKSGILETAEELRSENGEASQEPGGSQINMDDYDKEDDVQSLVGIGNLVSVDEDFDDESGQEEDDEDNSDKEDEKIKPTDNLIAVGHVFGDISMLEVYVYNEEDGDLYVHHDVLLPTIPLALEWLNFSPSGSTPGNLIALAGMSPEITIWDLDVVNNLEPALKLGEFTTKKKYQHRNHGHRDAVLDLSWNERIPNVLASGSVDRSVILWDLHKTRAVAQFKDFEEKVQTLEWHPSENNILVAGACDSSVKVLDCRIVEGMRILSADGEVEKVTWHPKSAHSVLVGTSNGVLSCVDCRSSNLLWSFTAHDKEITGLAVHSDKPDRLVTSSTDQTVRVWDLSLPRPKLLYTKPTTQGELQCLQVCPENPDIVCVGGNTRSNNFKLYDLSAEMQSNMETQDMEES